jgi:hypothetical protein
MNKKYFLDIINCTGSMVSIFLHVGLLLKQYNFKQFFFNIHESVHRKNILICIQQDATLHNLFYL